MRGGWRGDFEHRDGRQMAARAEGAQRFEPRSRSASHRLAGEAKVVSLNRARIERLAASDASGAAPPPRRPRSAGAPRKHGAGPAARQPHSCSPQEHGQRESGSARAGRPSRASPAPGATVDDSANGTDGRRRDTDRTQPGPRRCSVRTGEKTTRRGDTICATQSRH